MHRFRAVLVAMVMALAAPVSVQGESYMEFGDYRVHYNAFNATLLPPQVAKQHGISRSGYRAVLNVTVRRQLPEGGDEAVHADVSGTATNLTGQLKELELREIEEQEAVYYIAVIPVADGETLDFDLRVRPQGRDRAYGLRFRQQFFVR